MLRFAALGLVTLGLATAALGLSLMFTARADASAEILVMAAIVLVVGASMYAMVLSLGATIADGRLTPDVVRRPLARRAFRRAVLIVTAAILLVLFALLRQVTGQSQDSVTAPSSALASSPDLRRIAGWTGVALFYGAGIAMILIPFWFFARLARGDLGLAARYMVVADAEVWLCAVAVVGMGLATASLDNLPLTLLGVGMMGIGVAIGLFGGRLLRRVFRPRP